MAGALLLLGCNDYTTGQDPEPEGPLQVLRLTLFDPVSRDAPVFSDTSVPDCSKPENQASLTCTADPVGDLYSLAKSPPTPDSGREARVVFNKIPLFINDQELETVTAQEGGPPTYKLNDPSAVELTCADCTGVPPLTKSLIVSGAGTTSDPTFPISYPANLPYGPALLLQTPTEKMDPLAALEPATAYEAKVSARLAGRDRQAVQLDARALALLRFTTEPFQVLRAGIGDTATAAAGDPWVYQAGVGAGVKVAGMANNGVVALVLNAPVDDSAFTATTATATVGGNAVPVKLGISQLAAGKCASGRHRALYIFPAGGTWGAQAAGTEVQITLRGKEIKDLSQAAGHPAGMGRHTLGLDAITITATLSGKGADDSYKGLTAASVRATADCP